MYNAQLLLLVLLVGFVPCLQGFVPGMVRPAGVLRPRMNNISPALGASTTQLFNLFDRFARVAKSNLNNIAKKLEDPEKIMSQALEDMQTDLVKVRQSYAEVTASQRRMSKQKDEAAKLSQEWYERAQIALKAGDESLAKEALTRRQVQEDKVAELTSQVEAQTASLEKLYEGMQLLESKILESKAKKDQMVARARTASSTKKVNDMLSGVTGQSSVDAFERMEEKVEALEAAADVAEDMNASNLLSGGGGSVEAKFKELEGASAVDSELEKMKQSMLGGSSDDSKMLEGDVDEELEKLKRDAGL
ncbi:hypothetical protein TrLO_g9539 [Triparma laevis f. longispina]|uniref:Uncharacterized protein n=1 Tax=Triparma laevis f. longispina TaxID=1714387 RepID=A0A9W7CEC7_9STRA|nr:hypothetical protein TrLO_g9539 [Triparma laevis f. longispina]